MGGGGGVCGVGGWGGYVGWVGEGEGVKGGWVGDWG